jgi:hypothetical protein
MADQIKYYEQQEGWKHEYIHNGQCIVFERPREIGGGFVTVDLERRIFSGGYGWPREHAGTKTYAGRGWKNQIIRDAIDYLEQAMKS